MSADNHQFVKKWKITEHKKVIYTIQVALYRQSLIVNVANCYKNFSRVYLVTINICKLFGC